MTNLKDDINGSGPPDLLTADEAAALLRVSRMTVWRWARDGKFPPGTVIPLPGTVLRLRRDHIEALLNGGQS